jgi:hypothetical protein
MFVGCKLPHGLEIHHNDQTIVLSGANVDYDADSPWKNDLPPDSPMRASGVGLTVVEGARADAFKDWFDVSGKGPGPVSAGFIFYTGSKNEATKEAQSLEGAKTGLGGLDPDKDMPAGVETDADAAKK